MDKSSYNLLNDRKNLKYKMILNGSLVGLVTGIIIVLNRLAITTFSEYFKELYLWANNSPLRIISIFLLISFLGYISGIMVKKESMISGSGIPQVKGILQRKISVNWLRVLVYKFIGGVLALSVGLSVGREGPSVQIGASIGEGVSKYTKKAPMKRDLLITSGASAGLAAAFNSPLSGVMFALEELHRSFSPLVLVTAMSATLVADFVAKQFLGMEPSLKFSNVGVVSLKYYWTLILLGIFVGAIAIFFNKGIVLSQNIYGKMKKVPVEIKVLIPFLVTCIIGFLSPELLGGGHEIIISLSNGDKTLVALVILFIIKFILLLVCFGSGVPGGIFLPMLLLGSLLGDIFGVALNNIGLIPSELIINFIILGMAAYFAAIVKAPITAIVLITEMTGSFEHLLSISIVVFIATITSDLLKGEAVYEILLERLLKKIGVNGRKGSENKTLLEVPVEIGSLVDGKRIFEVKWPENLLMVGIRRGDNEFIPKGQTLILSGDYLIALVDNEESSSILEDLKSITIFDS